MELKLKFYEALVNIVRNLPPFFLKGESKF